MRAAWGAALALLIAAPASADTLIDNVDGLTLDAEGRVQRFNGLLIGNDGRVAQVLQRADKRPGKVDYRLDGKGRTVMPGLIAANLRLMDAALALLTAKAAAGTPPGPPRPEDRDVALVDVQQALFARGITAVTDMGTSIEDWQTYRRAGDLGTLNLRIMAYAGGVEAMILIGGPGPTPWLYDDRLRLNGLYLRREPVVLRAAAPSTRPAATPKIDSAETRQRNMMSRAAMDRFQVAVEAPDEAAVRAIADAVDELALTYQGERRWRLEGLRAVAPAEQSRLAAQKVLTVLQPRDPAAEPNKLPAPFAGIAMALTRTAVPGQADGYMTREDSLASWTIRAAYAGQAEGRFGRLSVGQRADFIVLDRDPTLAAPSDLRAIRVLQTWVNGRAVYRAEDRPDQTGG